MKKHIKIVAILFILTILFEIVLIAYNEVIFKLYDAKHLINNEPFTIQAKDITLRKEENVNIIEVNKNLGTVYNLCLNLKGQNRGCIHNRNIK